MYTTAIFTKCVTTTNYLIESSTTFAHLMTLLPYVHLIKHIVAILCVYGFACHICMSDIATTQAP